MRATSRYASAPPMPSPWSRRRAGLRLADGVIAEARIGLGGVALKPWRARGAEAQLAGQAPTEAVFQRAAEAALADAAPLGDNGFKIDLARRVVVRALNRAAADTPDRVPPLPGSVFAPVPEGAAHV